MQLQLLLQLQEWSGNGSKRLEDEHWENESNVWLILMAESVVELCEKIANWKAGMEVKGLKMNTGKTKIMFGCSDRQARGAG